MNGLQGNGFETAEYHGRMLNTQCSNNECLRRGKDQGSRCEVAELYLACTEKFSLCRSPWPNRTIDGQTTATPREMYGKGEPASGEAQLETQAFSSYSHSSFQMRNWLWFTIFTMLVAPAMAVDTQIVPVSTYSTATSNPAAIIPNVASSAFSWLVLLVARYLGSTTRSFLGPLMGISSVLWFIMRNDEAVKPSFAWVVFGVWSMAYLMYLSYQTRRIVHDRLYMLLALASSSICLFTVALVQKASIQGGLVTAIPPCASFAAYATAFCFPDRRHPVQSTAV